MFDQKLDVVAAMRTIDYESVGAIITVKDAEADKAKLLEDQSQHREADVVFYSSKVAMRVGAFISHVWTASRWLKALALYQYLNIQVAVVASVVTWLSLISGMVIVYGPTGMGGNGDLLRLFVGGPMVAFAVCFFCGHYLTAPVSDFWLDKSCIHQTRTEMKIQGVSALAEVVASSDRLVILWDDSYFDRLWCNAEVATFCSLNNGVDKIDFVPLWLAPWIISTMILDIVSICFSSKLFVLIPMTGDYFAKHLPSGEPWLINFLAQFVGIGLAFSIGYLPVVLPNWHSFRTKLNNHEQMLAQCKGYKLENAKCTVESDRLIVEEIITDLWSHEADPIKEFNRFVNEDLSAKLLEHTGRISRIPYRLCLIVLLPLTFSAAANVLGCDEMPCEVATEVELGQDATVAQQMITNMLAWAVGIFGIYPTTYPVMLSMLSASKERFATQPYMRAFVDFFAVVVSYMYMGFHEGFAAGLLNTASGQSATSGLIGSLWAVATIAYLILLVLWNVYLFRT